MRDMLFHRQQVGADIAVVFLLFVLGRAVNRLECRLLLAALPGLRDVAALNLGYRIVMAVFNLCNTSEQVLKLRVGRRLRVL